MSRHTRMWADLYDSLPIGFKFGAGSAQDYLVLDSILGREEREQIRDGEVLEEWDSSLALYPTDRPYMSLVRLLRPSAVDTSTLFAVKSTVVNGWDRRNGPATVDFNNPGHGARVLELIWNGTRMWRKRSTTFYQDLLHPHRGKQHIVELFDTFVNLPVPMVGGPRRCAVLELLGPSLSEIRTERASQRLETRVVMEATRQVLLALDFLHTQCGILYLGLDTASVLIKFATEQEAFDFYLYRDFQALDLSSIHVKLTGFNCAELIDNGPLPDDISWGPLREQRVQRLSTAPEIDPVLAHLNLRYLCQLDPEGLSADVWSIGFFVWELLTGETDIFPADSPPTLSWFDWRVEVRDMLAEYGTRCCLSFLKFVSERSYPRKPIDHPIEDPGLNRFPESHEILFNFPDALRTDQGWSMRERLVAHDVLPDRDVDQVVAVLRGCFQADPSRRLTARELLETEWLREETAG